MLPSIDLYNKSLTFSQFGIIPLSPTPPGGWIRELIVKMNLSEYFTEQVLSQSQSYGEKRKSILWEQHLSPQDSPVSLYR